MANISSEQALQKLIEGNKRFVAGELAKKDIGDSRRKELTKGQSPFAVIVGCADSRVSPELIFDQGLGDLFVVRVAGNVVDPVVMGSVEYAVEHLGSPLIVLLGHACCGAVKATADGGEAPGSIGSIVEKIQPSIEKAKAAGTVGSELCELAANENVRAAIDELEKSEIVRHLVKNGELKIAGAKYYLDSGKVEFMD